MNGFLGTLRFQDPNNWDICKSSKLWGIPAGQHAELAVRSVRPGDVLFVWRGGGKRNKAGLLARAKISGPVRLAKNPPWPDPDRYTHVLPIEVTDELAVPIGDKFPGNQKGILFQVQNMWLQWGFCELPPDVVERMEAAFHR